MHTTRRGIKSFLLCSAVAAVMVAWVATATASDGDLAPRKPTRPNIVLMFVDNVGYGDLGCYGNKVIKTPRIDQFATESVRCTDFYIGSPSCMPSRGGLLTGRHPVRNGLNEQIYLIDEHDQVGLPRSEIILPRYSLVAKDMRCSDVV